MHNLLIVWTDTSDTGIAIIDQQHRGIISIINTLFFFIQDKQGHEMLAPTIAMIEQYTRLHFATEEKLLKLTGYPDFDAHKKLHDALIRQSYVIGNDSRRAADPDRYLMFLKNWWIEHINRHDQRYAEHLRHHPALKAAGSGS